ncbi:MAG: hypothetical protein IK095_08235 [Oscillospiraceae bacterium]|nr:hypothetical protein [Oscillospiraceae bacterium]
MNEKKPVGKILAASPVLVLFLGACPALGATADVRSALYMGAAVLAVLLGSWLLYTILSPLIAEEARIAAIVLIAAGLAAAVQLLMRVFLPAALEMLGLYLAVVAVDLLVFAQTEKRSIGGTLLTGLCFALLLFVTAALRELFGAASFAGKELAFLAPYKIGLLLQAPGGFIVLSLVAALVSKIFPARTADTGWVSALREEKKEGEA